MLSPAPCHWLWRRQKRPDLPQICSIVFDIAVVDLEMDNRKIGRAPDFTAACIVMFGVNLAWILIFLYAAFGLIAAVFVGLVLNHALNWIKLRRRASRAPAETSQNHNSS